MPNGGGERDVGKGVNAFVTQNWLAWLANVSRMQRGKKNLVPESSLLVKRYLARVLGLYCNMQNMRTEVSY